MTVPQRLYIAGPMTGLPQFNFPAFDAAAARLRQGGHVVISPSELDDPESRAAALASPDGNPRAYAEQTGETWGDLLARDVKLVADQVDAVVVLPGWEKSRGARLETFVATLCEKPVLAYPGLEPIQAHPTPDVQAAGEVRVTNEKTGGAKGAKPEAMALLPWDALLDVAKVYDFGAQKYAPNNWRKGYDWSLSFSALQRHLAAFWTGQEHDDESALPHLAHAAFHVFALLVFAQQKRYAELDDRPPLHD